MILMMMTILMNVTGMLTWCGIEKGHAQRHDNHHDDESHHGTNHDDDHGTVSFVISLPSMVFVVSASASASSCTGTNELSTE
mmetsp:Transcript_23/g.54  ORF Transcript_23/g.54 Transcript_23/m.54 type:complete len:82 (-) Transcript_23:331-576(-)